MTTKALSDMAKKLGELRIQFSEWRRAEGDAWIKHHFAKEKEKYADALLGSAEDNMSSLRLDLEDFGARKPLKKFE